MVLKSEENLVALCRDFKSLGFLPCLKSRPENGGLGANDILLPTDVNIVKYFSGLWSLVQIFPVNG